VVYFFFFASLRLCERHFFDRLDSLSYLSRCSLLIYRFYVALTGLYVFLSFLPSAKALG
jgi:hypothetical protein